MLPPLLRSAPEDTARHGLAHAAWPADLATPVALFAALRRAGRRPCLLESVDGPARLARHSILGVDPVARFTAGPGPARLEMFADGSPRDIDGGALDALRAATQALLPAAAPPPPGLPPFVGGWIGLFGYEFACSLEPRVPRVVTDPWARPDVDLLLYRTVVAIDHAAQRLIVVTHSDDGFVPAQARIEALAADALGGGSPGRAVGTGTGAKTGVGRGVEHEPTWTASLTDSGFCEGVSRLRHDIGQGEVFQAVLSRRFERPYLGDPLQLYRALRMTNPSPHMFLFENDGLTLVGSSPERLVAVRDGRVELRPIAGTRRRDPDPDADERLARELRSDVKERAEHDMLVDLARNDVGRVARIGSVAVREHAALESFARVHHLVSRVEGRLAAGRDALDALAASFPAGTVSGAPKVRAMELLAGLEPQTRGPYAGAFGYIDAAGQLDMAIVIRCFALARGRATAQAGAGIVFDSVPELEEAETRHKAAALFEAAELATRLDDLALGATDTDHAARCTETLP